MRHFGSKPTPRKPMPSSSPMVLDCGTDKEAEQNRVVGDNCNTRCVSVGQGGGGDKSARKCNVGLEVLLRSAPCCRLNKNCTSSHFFKAVRP